MDFDNPNYGYYFILVIVAALITIVSYLPGGIIYLLITGVIAALGIGYFSKDEKSALLVGAFFGFALVGIDLYFGPGLFVPSSPISSDPLINTFLPFIRSAVITSVCGGVLGGIGYLIRNKH